MPNRFLLIQLASLGDMILTTPALSALREAHPDAHIAMLTTAQGAAALNGTSLVDEIILFDKYIFDSPESAAESAQSV
jgi:ADP-heptose:LPS heptosyltransferase